MTDDRDLPITEDWLREVKFGWHQLERQTDKHWLLWLGSAIDDRMTCYEDLGIEVSPVRGNDEWFCWLRADTAGRYHRFIHIRYMRTRGDLITLIEALTGQTWNPENNFGGSIRTPEQAARIRQDLDRFDQRLLRECPKWSQIEEDDTRGRALPEHMESHAKTHQDGKKLP